MIKGFYLLILGFLSLALSGCNIQRNLLYYPGNANFSDIERYASANGLKMWPDSSASYRGIVSRRGPANFKGTIIVFHGNGGPAIFRIAYIAALQERGYRVVLAEYPGYGGRVGELSEKSFVADARQTALRAKKDFGDPIFLWGESLGCGVASALAADPEIHAEGVVMLTPWDSLLNVARAKFPWLPVRLLLTDVYDNVANLAQYKGPVAVIMSKQDEVIPNRSTEHFYTSLAHSKRLWTFENAGHNDWPSGPGLAWWDEVMSFLSSNRSAKPFTGAR
jgi:pimeloyl-ACP methyl ester carboxylesterase